MQHANKIVSMPEVLFSSIIITLLMLYVNQLLAR